MQGTKNTKEEPSKVKPNNNDNSTKYLPFGEIKSKISSQLIYIDVRSENEFEIDHVPGSINIPILDNEEREIIGILYKKSGQKEAIKRGVEIFQKKFSRLYSKLSIIINQIDKKKEFNICIYCWRGGMRSNSMAFLTKSFISVIENHKISVFAIDKGYKGYREYVKKNLDDMQINPSFIVLHGLTGTGKTELLIELERMGEPTIDLEDLAKHRSSLFGGVGLKPKSQKSFESKLLYKLQKLNNERFIFIEGESRRIGDVILNNNVFDKMTNGINIKIEANIEIRKERLVYEYTKHASKDKIKLKNNNNKLLEITKKLKKISNKQKDEIIQSITTNNLTKAAEHIINYYYDPLYKYSIDSKKYYKNINSDNITVALNDLKNARIELQK